MKFCFIFNIFLLTFMQIWLYPKKLQLKLQTRYRVIERDYELKNLLQKIFVFTPHDIYIEDNKS